MRYPPRYLPCYTSPGAYIEKPDKSNYIEVAEDEESQIAEG